LDPERKLTWGFAVRMTAAEADALIRLAAQQRRTVSALLRAVLRRVLGLAAQRTP
jgi:hypothetical protein